MSHVDDFQGDPASGQADSAAKTLQIELVDISEQKHRNSIHVKLSEETKRLLQKKLFQRKGHLCVSGVTACCEMIPLLVNFQTNLLKHISPLLFCMTVLLSSSM